MSQPQQNAAERLDEIEKAPLTDFGITQRRRSSSVGAKPEVMAYIYIYI